MAGEKFETGSAWSVWIVTDPHSASDDTNMNIWKPRARIGQGLVKDQRHRKKKQPKIIKDWKEEVEKKEKKKEMNA